MTRHKQFKAIIIVIVSVFVFPLLILVVNLYTDLDPKWTDYNTAVNDRNKLYADSNSFCFTDKDRSFKKPKGVYRIAVLGDSFIWGDGLPYEKVWSHKLERMILSEYDSVEVLHWGLCGWSTSDQYEFYTKYGKDFDIDLLIVAWVDNDPDLHHLPVTYFTADSIQYPNLYHFSPRLARMVNNIKNNDGYDESQAYTYSDINLSEYQRVLVSFQNYMQVHHTPVLFVMTPHAFDYTAKENFKKGERIIRSAGLTCVNLMSETEEKLGDTSQVRLQASPVNSHPGDLLTEEFARQTYAFLSKHHYLSTLSKRKSIKAYL